MPTFYKTLEVLIPILMGLGLRMSGVFGDREGDVLRSVVVRLCLPLLVFFSMYDANPKTIESLPVMVLAFVVLTCALFVVGWGCSRMVKDPAAKAAIHVCVLLGNYGWMGFGVCEVLFAEPGLRRAVFFIVLWWPVFYGLGIPIGMLHHAGQKGRINIKKALGIALPTIGALIVGLGFNVGHVELADIIESNLRPFAEMTVPLILVSVGLILDLTKIHKALVPALGVSFVSLLVAPLIGWAVAEMTASGDSMAYTVIIMEAGMPVATTIPLLAENYDLDLDVVTTCIIVSTLLSMITVPGIGMLLLG